MKEDRKKELAKEWWDKECRERKNRRELKRWRKGGSGERYKECDVNSPSSRGSTPSSRGKAPNYIWVTSTRLAVSDS